MKKEKQPYFVEVNNNGCSKCGHDRTWDVIDPDGFALDRSWEDEEEADWIAEILNEAYKMGERSMTPIA